MMKAFKTISEKFTQAWSACMICMVQGDLTVLTMSHAFTASKTGILTGLAYVLTIKGDGEPRSQWMAAWITGVLTMVSDIVVHPSHFGEQWVEAFCTGVGAAALCFIWERSSDG
jgi:hypothetical protein